ncbi:hypothetical protein OUZ56_026486 [Daphnia magna]|uniref:Uncharacterized protein n=1 Tax=Daphnia magna TaxID=35525 RepID=A0ABQ9ZM05_9CRUS|nr:hypothetical protein OUZ56_026486 [Daphnia magna]
MPTTPNTLWISRWTSPTTWLKRSATYNAKVAGQPITPPQRRPRLQCSPQNVTFETVFTSCGAQPKVENPTVGVECWELTKYSECYWHTNFVNFNGKDHTFKNNTWAPYWRPNLATHGRRFIDAAPLEIVNSLEMTLLIGYVTEMSGERNVETVLVHPGQAKDILFMTRVGYWLWNLGILSGVGVSIALAFRFCELDRFLGFTSHAADTSTPAVG